MRIAVVGSGGVGGYFGGRLAASGVDVTFIGRGAHLAAMQQHGLSGSSVERDGRGLGGRAVPACRDSDRQDVGGSVTKDEFECLNESQLVALAVDPRDSATVYAVSSSSTIL